MSHAAEYPFGPDGVSKSLLFIEEKLKELRVKRRDVLEALLISEEAMLLLGEHAPEDANIKVVITRHMGVPRIRLTIPGTSLAMDDHRGGLSIDQLGEEAENAIRSIMLRSYADSIKYRHSKSENIITIITGIPERVFAANAVTAIFLAVAIGFLVRDLLPPATLQWIVTNLLNPVENLFVSALMCITAPAVFVSITCAMFRFEGFSELGRSGKAVVITYLLTSVAATLIGVFIFSLFQPGEAGVLAHQAEAAAGNDFSILGILAKLIPPNIVEPFISVDSLHLVVVAATIGTALTMCGKQVRHLKGLLEEMDVLCSKVSALIMRIVPLVIFCSTVNVLWSPHAELLLSAIELIPTIAAGILALLVLYCLILVIMARLNPFPFVRKYVPAVKNIFLKGSSVAAIPINMRICRRQLGIPQSVCMFSIPLGATINMDGSCICLTIISLFFARICGVTFGINEMIFLLLIILILSLGAPIAPGTMILCMITLLTQMGIDTGVISVIIGINFVLEMLLGMVNSIGDVVVALLVARRERTLDMEIYKKR